MLKTNYEIFPKTLWPKCIKHEVEGLLLNLTKKFGTMYGIFPKHCDRNAQNPKCGGPFMNFTKNIVTKVC